MCGIAGILNLKAPQPISYLDMSSMAGYLTHRGPNESGLYLDNWIGLAQTRLSIIDLSGGTQPIHNEDKSLWIIFNGEIYNYIELKNELINLGHKFYTNTDTEVLLHLFEQDGEKFLNKLNGQFALAIWDSKNEELFVARDRVGKKPLFYTIVKNRFIFASEIKAIFANDNVHREIDVQSLKQIFTFWTTIPGQTVFKGIKELPAGSFLTIKKGELRIKEFWDFGFTRPENLNNYKTDDIVEYAKDILYDSIKIRLRADVPVGTYLSGGLDSSGITSLVRNNFNNKLMTFGIRFEDSSFDEGQFQKEMVSNLKVEHNEILATNSNIGELLSDVIWFTEIPILRLSPVPLFMLSKLVNRIGFRVVLTGEGADEVFGGYNIFREALVRAFWSKLPESKVRPLLLERLYPYIFRDAKSKAGLRAFFKSGIEDPANPFFSHLVRWKNTSKINRFLSDSVYEQTLDYDPINQLTQMLPPDFYNWDTLQKAQYLEMKLFMSNYLLSSQGDRVSMAHSLEMRMPYLDYRLIEFMSKIPSYLKIRGLNEKFILKKIFKDILPKNILNRAKNPYRAPIKDSILNGKMNIVHQYLSSPKLGKSELFNSEMVSKLLNKLFNSEFATEFDNMTLVGILTTQILHDKFVENFPFNNHKNFKFDLFYDERRIPNRAAVNTH